MKYLERLRGESPAKRIYGVPPLTKPTEPGFVSFGSATPPREDFAAGSTMPAEAATGTAVDPCDRSLEAPPAEPKAAPGEVLCRSVPASTPAGMHSLTAGAGATGRRPGGPSRSLVPATSPATSRLRTARRNLNDGHLHLLCGVSLRRARHADAEPAQHELRVGPRIAPAPRPARPQGGDGRL